MWEYYRNNKDSVWKYVCGDFIYNLLLRNVGSMFAPLTICAYVLVFQIVKFTPYKWF